MAIHSRRVAYLTVSKQALGTGPFTTIVSNKHIPQLTTAGRNFIHAQAFTNTAAGTRGAGFIGLTETAIDTTVLSNTTLSNEIATGGLTRADATTKTHNSGEDTTLIEHTFTSSSTFTTVQAVGLFNAATVGTLVLQATFPATALVSTDKLKVSIVLIAG